VPRRGLARPPAAAPRAGRRALRGAVESPL